ncbi:hypothetical protein [Pseudomonas chlororaphis]|uniref:hypothetical protein n=1 Tax=Pseudomonas chlororaphis TaxID=587753 RepID=UPI0009BB1102|nr:hypothetical protein [Pseudomonas chlororaphis]
MNQTDFGRVGAVSKGSQILYEKGDGSPTADYLSAIALAGVDVQYVLTGVRSSVALTPEERLLIERFRESEQELKDAALRVLLGGLPTGAASHTFKEVGQYIHGSVNQEGLTLNVGGSKRKK